MLVRLVLRLVRLHGVAVEYILLAPKRLVQRSSRDPYLLPHGAVPGSVLGQLLHPSPDGLALGPGAGPKLAQLLHHTQAAVHDAQNRSECTWLQGAPGAEDIDGGEDGVACKGSREGDLELLLFLLLLVGLRGNGGDDFWSLRFRQGLKDLQQLQCVMPGFVQASVHAGAGQVGVANVAVELHDGGVIDGVQTDESTHVAVLDACVRVGCIVPQVIREVRPP